MSAMQAAKRRPVTYGKKSHAKSHGFGLDALADDASLKPTSQVRVPAASPSNSRQSNGFSPASQNANVFDVESSEDELRILDVSSPNLSSRRLQSPAPARSRDQRPHFNKPSVSPQRSASVKSEKKRKRTANLKKHLSESSSRSPNAITTGVDSSVASTPQTTATLTPEPVDERLITPGIRNRMSAITPKQSQIWQNLFEDSESDTTPATKMQKLRLQSTAKSESKALHNASPASKRLIDVLQRPEDQSEMSIDSSSVITADDSISGSQDADMRATQRAEPSQQSSSSAGPRVTYAQQRSYLQDQVNGLEEMLAQPLDAEYTSTFDSNKHSSRTSVKTADRMFDFPDSDEDEGTSQMKNIHELRASGGLRRFQDETTDLIDDLNQLRDTPMSRKRQVYITLATKLRDIEYRKRFRHSSYDGQLFERCSRERDSICLAAMSACAYFLLQPPVPAECILHATEHRLLDVLARALVLGKDLPVIARERETNMSKSAQRSIVEFKNVLYGSVPAFSGVNGASISPQRLGLVAVESLVRRAREAKRMDVLLTPTVMDALLKIGDTTCLQLQNSEGGLLWHDAETVLSVLESATVSTKCAYDQDLWSPARLDKVTEQLTAVLRPDAAGTGGMRPLALKVCINLANNNERNSDEFAKRPFIHALLLLVKQSFEALSKLTSKLEHEDQEAAQQQDTLVLSLGALANLTEVSGFVRQCIERDERSTFDALVKLFAIGQAQTAAAASEAASRAAVAYGYLAILLANLALNARLRARIAAQLPNGRLSVLVEAVESFIILHGETDMKEESSSSEWVAFTGRLQAVRDALTEVIAVPGAHGGIAGKGV